MDDLNDLIEQEEENGDPDENDDFEEPIEPLSSILAQMLPEEFKNADPAEYFPQFRKGKVLRFSRLFGPAKANSRPEIWKGVGNRRRIKEQETKAAVASISGDGCGGDVPSCSKSLSCTPAPPPPLDMCQPDQELMLMRPSNKRKDKHSADRVDKDEGGRIAAWRFGPAQYWFDQMGLPAQPKNFDYGFKLRKEGAPEAMGDHDMAPETFLPVNLEHWEDKVIWNGEDVRQEVIDKYKNGEQPISGWVPTQSTRTYASFMTHLKSGTFDQLFTKNANSTKQPGESTATNINFVREPGRNGSIFPGDNHELLYGRWEDKVIWDDQNMNSIPEPLILTLDIHDDPELFGLPPDKGSNKYDDDHYHHTKEHHHHTKGMKGKEAKASKVVLKQVEKRRKEEEDDDEKEERNDNNNQLMNQKDPFNLSNDQYYAPKNTTRQLSGAVSGSRIQHSLPAQHIQRPFFPTYFKLFTLRNYYRLPLKGFKNGPLASATFHTVNSLSRHIKEREKEREKKRMEMGGGDIFFMRTIDDLSSRDGDIILCEFSEEHPPIMQQTGMASKIKNYHKRKAGKDEGPPEMEFGETAFTHTSPFLGQLNPGQALQALENNLYRGPIYSHRMSPTDFLVIRTRTQYFLREVKHIFTVGQLCPLFEVPSPNSKRATNFIRDFLLAFIYRLFWSNVNPESNERPMIRMEDIKLAFPSTGEPSIRKRLKQCADFKRLGAGTEQNFWVLKEDFRLPSMEEVEALVSPEMCCANISMMLAEQRLKDAGYGEKYFFTPDDDDEEQVTMEDEIKCAPWNTTRAYISAVKGKCMLDQTGIADPTGHGQGFSYVRVSAKPPKQPKEEKEEKGPKRLVTGTDADLRKLPLKEAKEMLRKFGLKEEEITGLTRWEIIDVIRTLSTKQAKSTSDYSGIGKFARGNIRFSMAEMQDKYRQDCQRIFDLQNRILGSDEVISTDEESSGEDNDSEIEEMQQDIEHMLSGGRAQDAEEKEKAELQAMLRGGTSAQSDPKNSAHSSDMKPSKSSKEPKKLKIYRTFLNKDGKQEVKIEVVNRPQIIDAYLKIRTTRDEAFIKHFAQMDEEYKEERRKQKRRIQDQLRRIRKNEAKVEDSTSSTTKTSPPKKPPPPPKPHLMKMKCSACGGMGHMKTNKNCPLYGTPVKDSPSLQVAITDEQLAQELQAPEGKLISVEGTKVKFNRALVEHAERMKQRSLTLHIPKSVIKNPNPGGGSQTSKFTRVNDMIAKREQRKQSTSHAEYLSEGAPKQKNERRRADPRIVISTILQNILNEVKEIPNAPLYFMDPVNAKAVPDYYNIVKSEMHLRKIKEKISRNEYETRESFLNDMQLVLSNSRLYNGDNHEITQVAHTCLQLTGRRIAEKEEKLMRLEKAINPLLDDNDVVAFNYILEKIVQECKDLPKSYAFHHPVDGKKIKTYHEKIKYPMDLGTMESKVKKQSYTNIEMFVKDIEQILENSLVFNGKNSVFTMKAREIRDAATAAIQREMEQLSSLEKNIQGALEAAETESLLTAASSLVGEGEVIGGEEEQEDGEILNEDVEEGEDNMVDGDGGMVGEGVGDYDPVGEFLEGMNRSGQLHSDLAMSDSDDEDGPSAGKRPRLDSSALDLADL